MTLRRFFVMACVCVAACLTATACGSNSQPSDPRVLLGQAKQVLDATPSVHLTLTSSNVGGSGPVITGGEGDVARPDNFQGTVSVLINGFPTTVGVISTQGVFYARPPFSPRFDRADPGAFGLADPAKLLDPSSGLSNLLTTAQDVRPAPSTRFRGEELDQVDVTVSGASLAGAFPGVDPRQNLMATLGIAHDSHQLRRVMVSGPAFSSYTLVLDRYGEHVVINPPT